MDEKERQRTEYIKRNEKNKIFQKKLKIYYYVALGTLLLEFLLGFVFISIPSHPMFILYIMGALFILWMIWAIGGYCIIACPHCGNHISKMAIGFECCPYCGTKIKVYPDLQSEDNSLLF